MGELTDAAAGTVVREAFAAVQQVQAAYLGLVRWLDERPEAVAGGSCPRA